MIPLDWKPNFVHKTKPFLEYCYSTSIKKQTQKFNRSPFPKMPSQNPSSRSNPPKKPSSTRRPTQTSTSTRTSTSNSSTNPPRTFTSRTNTTSQRTWNCRTNNPPPVGAQREEETHALNTVLDNLDAEFKPTHKNKKWAHTKEIWLGRKDSPEKKVVEGIGEEMREKEKKGSASGTGEKK